MKGKHSRLIRHSKQKLDTLYEKRLRAYREPGIMKRTFFFGLVVLWLFEGCQIKQVTKVPVGPGWAKTMVNGTIFRKNAVVSHGGYQYVAYYDSSATVTLTKRKLGSHKWQIMRTQYTGNALDAHNAIAIMVDGDGYLHMAWDHHNNKLNYCQSTAPGSLVMGPPQPMVGPNENSVSYPEFYRLPSGNLIFAYRDGQSGKGNLVMNRYDIETRRWERIHDNILDGEGQRNAYWQLCISEKGAIHLSWVWRETYNVETNHDMGYAVSRDAGKTWQKSTGEQYELPIRQGTAEYAAKIPQNSNLINQTSIATDDFDNPFIATYYRSATDSCTQYYLIGKRESEWFTSKATSRTQDFNLSGMGSRSIPISRPQLVFKRAKNRKALYLIYRDDERPNRVVISRFDLATQTWSSYDVARHKLGRWEPAFDTELWKVKNKLHLFVQEVGQESGERAVDMEPTEVSIIEIKLK